MAQEKRDFDAELWHIMDALADSVLDASDEEVREEVRADGEDPTDLAGRTKSTLLSAVRVHRRRELAKARRDYDSRVAATQFEEANIPESPQECRELLASILAAEPQLQQGLTLQFRDFTTVPDEDVFSCLRQMQSLGILADFSKKEPGGSE